MGELELLTNEHFTVSIDNVLYGFARASNISAELEYEPISEGGRNQSPLLFRKPKSKPDVLTLERGVRLVNGAASITLAVGAKLTSIIIGVTKEGVSCLKYTFDEGIVTKVEWGNLDAMGHEILIEKVEIAHTGLQTMKKKENT